MKALLSTIALIALASLACAAPVECDDDEHEEDGECVDDDGFGVEADADTDTDTDTEPDPPDFDVLLGSGMDGGSAFWTADADVRLTSAVLYILGTEDPAFEGCSLAEGGGIEAFGGPWCGAWSETHDAFESESSGSLRLDLDVVLDVGDQERNSSSMFGRDESGSAEFTALVMVEGPDGWGCDMFGMEQFFYEDVCP